MELVGERLIKADRTAVFAALNDPEILQAAIPGCKALAREADDTLSATVQAKVGPVKATFKGKVSLSNIVAPESYTITGEGKGGAAGFAKGRADVSLRQTDDGTLLAYTVKADVGGKLAQIGGRLIDGAAKKLAGEFFDAFAGAVAPEPEAKPEAAAPPAAPKQVTSPPIPDSVHSAPDAPAGGALAYLVILGGGALLGVILSAVMALSK